MWRLICNPPGYHSLLSVSDQTVGEEHLLNILESHSHLQKKETCRAIKRDAWYFITRGFILKTIQWHIHTGSWSLVNCWREGSTLPYKGCS